MGQQDSTQERGPVSLARVLREGGPTLARDVVEEVFQGVLGRSPGHQGAEVYPRRLREEGLALRDLVSELIARPEFPKLQRRLAVFDGERYLRDHPDIAEANLDPLEHYVAFGRKEGRAAYDMMGARFDPPGSNSEYFDGERYLADHADVAEGGLNPLDHYLKHGLREGRPAYGKDGARIEAPAAPVVVDHSVKSIVVEATVPPDILQLVQDMITTRLVAEGLPIQLPPGDPPTYTGMESQLRTMLLTLGILAEHGFTDAPSSTSAAS